MRDATQEEVVRERRLISWDEHTAVVNEINHRVKNNFQVIDSLFSLQADRTTQPEVLDKLGEMQNRVRAIASIHELYSHCNFSAVLFGEYLSTLARELESYFHLGPRVEVQLSLADLALHVDDAEPLALISNELLSNAFKHAFPDTRTGNISVALRYAAREKRNDGEPWGELQITDDGIGLPQGVDLSTADSMGFHIVRILTQQLQGRGEVHTGSGTAIGIFFPLGNEHTPPGEQP
jgi:two-component sensor histidine kinase